MLLGFSMVIINKEWGALRATYKRVMMSKDAAPLIAAMSAMLGGV